MKGAAWGAIASCASRPDAAAAAWERLLQETVLAAPGTEQALTVAIASYDMTYQLNEIEVRCRTCRSSMSDIRSESADRGGRQLQHGMSAQRDRCGFCETFS